MTLRAALRAARVAANRTGVRHFVIRNPSTGRWITIHGRHVQIDRRGRILKGLATDLEGAPLRRFGSYFRERHRLEHPDRLCRLPRGAQTYSRGEAYQALLDANPLLMLHLENVGGAGAVGRSLRKEQELHRRGVKGAQTFTGTEGGIDDIANYLNTRPEKLGSLANAIAELIPARSPAGGRPRWLEDFLPIVPVLEDAMNGNAYWGGHAINLPEPAVHATLALSEVERCREAVGDALATLGAKYRSKRPRRAMVLSLPAAPF